MAPPGFELLIRSRIGAFGVATLLFAAHDALADGNRFLTAAQRE